MHNDLTLADMLTKPDYRLYIAECVYWHICHDRVMTDGGSWMPEAPPLSTFPDRELMIDFVFMIVDMADA